MTEPSSAYTPLSPDAESRLREKLFMFFRSFKMTDGSVLPAEAFRFDFYPSLNPAEQHRILEMVYLLVREGVLIEREGDYVLTACGVSVVYRPADDRNGHV